MKSKEAKMLVSLLHQASKLEHCLLDAYLYTAASIKSMPQEFEKLANGKPNPRRAVQYEKAKQWKQNILNVSHEEMLHLHYVQCLLRALDESPYFNLPNRNEKGAWVIPNWDIYTPNAGEEAGAEVPLGALDIEQIKRFILFESTDSLQDANPFGPKVTALFEALYDFELDFHLEGILFNVEETKREKLLKALRELYGKPLPKVKKALARATRDLTEDELKHVRFQSIGDFYMKGILPLYEQAFDKGYVKNSNLAFNNELLGPDAAEGFLPVGPVYRSKNYTDFSNKNTANPLKYFKNVRSIVEEIVDEGEGFDGFEKAATDFLAYVKSLGATSKSNGVREYLQLLKTDQANSRNPQYTTPQGLADGQLCRQSHLYRFAMIYRDMLVEKEHAELAGDTFSVVRQPLSVEESNHAVRKMVEEMPRQFNSCYMVMLIWLARIYEVKQWQTDKDRRYAIEMIATWPLMSLAIRPFLEMISFFPVDLNQLYCLEPAGMPGIPTEAQQLLAYFNSTDRSEAINEEIDYLAMRVLANAAAWAKEQIEVVQANYSGNDAKMVVTRLEGISRLNEFENQFPFRKHGGYSNQLPDLTYQQQFPDAFDYSEDPSALTPVFKDTLLLRLRFGGFGLVQLSTDPDPPTDESGCTGTHMLHAADGDKRFDRAQVWQNMPGETNNILREPRKALPEIGVMLQDLTLQIPEDAGAVAGYVPLAVMSSAGAVQTAGVQQYLNISGLNDLVKYSADQISGKPFRVNLLEKDGVRPYGYGENHLVSKDGEPIDPFILSITDADFKNLFQREIYNGGKTMQEMNPLQRLESARWPTGFDFNLGDMPDWLTDKLPPSYMQNLLNGPIAYLKSRAAVLNSRLEDLLTTQKPDDQAWVDETASFAERLSLINMPRGTTVGWLTVLLNYGHSVSGSLVLNETNNTIFEFIEKKLGIRLSGQPAETDRSKPNSRWVVKYTEGIMDTDALTDLVYGELYIPVQVKPGNKPFTISKTWTFTAGMKEVVAQYTCDFTKPFWANFSVDKSGKVRKVVASNDGKDFTIVETLAKSAPDGYTYEGKGFAGITNYTGVFSVGAAKDGSVEFTINVSFNYDSEEAFIGVAKIIGGFFKGVTGKLNSKFGVQ